MISILTLSRTPAYVERLSRALHLAEGVPPGAEQLLGHQGNIHLTAMGLKHGWAVAELGGPYTFSSGNNLLAGAARHDWLLLLNDDAIPEPDAIFQLWQHRMSAQVQGALITHSNGTVNHAGSLVDAGTLRTDHVGRHDPVDRWARDECPLRPAVTFAAVLIQASWWRRLGGLDERYVWGWEDTDFCLRTLEAGGDIRVNLAARFTHDECGTRPRNGPRDLDNYKLFRQLWAGPRVGTAVTKYLARHGRVEGCVIT